jgi:hypothetical protein
MLRDTERLRLVRLVDSLGLPDCWIAAGFVRNAVWDSLHARTPSPPVAIRDAADRVHGMLRYRGAMRGAVVLLVAALGCAANKQPATDPATESAHWVSRHFGDGRVQYRVPSDWRCQAGESGETLCLGNNEFDVAKISAGVPQGPPDEMYEKMKSTSPPNYAVTRTKIGGHDGIEVRSGDGAIVALVFSDDGKYFFMLGWLLKAPFAPQCRAVLRTVAFGP